MFPQNKMLNVNSKAGCHRVFNLRVIETIGSSILEVFETWMRLLLSLKSIDTEQRQETDYHYQLQSFIYSLLENSVQFSQLHDKKGYKFFCFSNIFSPSGSNDNTDIRYVIISSPRDFVRYVSVMLIKIRAQGTNQLIHTHKISILAHTMIR